MNKSKMTKEEVTEFFATHAIKQAFEAILKEDAMKKRESILDTDQMKKKLAKMSPRDREKVEQNIIETEIAVARWRKETERIMTLPKKEDRLKALYKRHLNFAFQHGITFAGAIHDGRFKSRKEIIEYQKRNCIQAVTCLTLDLKQAEVLPLGN
jgi:hypothetical protein